MRLSNRNRIPVFSFIYSLVGIIFILGVIAYILEINKFDIFGNKVWILLAIPLMLFLLLYFIGRPVFEYDSDGEALNFKNRNVISFLDKNLNDEFPKYKLLHYEVINGLVLKRLYLTIASKRSNSLILRYDISYLSKKELNDLKFSLSKVIKNNKEKKSTQIS